MILSAVNEWCGVVCGVVCTVWYIMVLNGICMVLNSMVLNYLVYGNKWYGFVRPV